MERPHGEVTREAQALRLREGELRNAARPEPLLEPVQPLSDFRATAAETPDMEVATSSWMVHPDRPATALGLVQILDRQICERTALRLFYATELWSSQSAVGNATSHSQERPVTAKTSGISTTRLVRFLRVKRKDVLSLTTGRSTYYWGLNRNPLRTPVFWTQVERVTDTEGVPQVSLGAPLDRQMCPTFRAVAKPRMTGGEEGRSGQGTNPTSP